MVDPETAVLELTVSSGAGITTNDFAADVPPPGSGVMTVIERVPAAARSSAGIVACNSCDDTNVVARSDPFQAAEDVGTNRSPNSVTVTAADPATALAGEIEFSTGSGLIDASTVN